MRQRLLLLFFLPLSLFAQKKPLDHTVYDSWQSLGERLVSHDGKWLVYAVTPQEGDAVLYVQSAEKPEQKQGIPRGYNAVITEDSRYLVFRIRPLYSQTREARMKKRRTEDLPKDSIGILELGKEAIVKLARVKSYKTPEKGSGWVAVHKEADPAAVRPASLPTQKTVDSLRQRIDSLAQLVMQLKNIKAGARDAEDADETPVAGAGADGGSDLVLRNLSTGKERIFKQVTDYAFSKYGQKLVLRLAKAPRDSQSKAAVVVVDLKSERTDTVLKGGNDFRGFTFSDDGSKLAFVAERDTNTKALQKFYGLYLYRDGDEGAGLLIEKKSVGMEVGMTVSENGMLGFSKSGNRLHFGVAPIQPARDTSLVEIDLVRLDVWHYKDDYLQTQQLFNLQNELKRTYLTVYDFEQNKIIPLGSPGLPTVLPTAEGEGQTYLAATDTGRRVAVQWTGNTLDDIYAVNATTGERTLVKKNFNGISYPSATGRYILLYDRTAKHYFVWDGKALKNATAQITVPLYNEETDVPDDPSPYGVMGWHEGDSAVYVYDRYDVWKVDPSGKRPPKPITFGRPQQTSYRYLRVNADERFISFGQPLFFRGVHQKTKAGSLVRMKEGDVDMAFIAGPAPYAYASLLKARSAGTLVYSRESFAEPANLFLVRQDDGAKSLPGWHTGGYPAQQLSDLNPQQKNFNWGTASLFQWKTFNGKTHTGVLYKPEDFDSTKKYPLIFYFYERHAADLHQYRAPSPTASALNIPFFVSRGYLVCTPDIIYYTKGHPAKDAYNAVVSAAQTLAKNRWVDAKNMAIQGQSWGGIQVAQLITMTNLFKAAWAGAPVANMTSAYGGIRWESGLNRQFQYEKSQSRIGATLWQRPDLYIQNSPLFHLPKVQTPVVIMANDADGAVPWYQGIELFTGLRRLGKRVWMLNYNGEAHNLVERRNRKDIQIRQQQFFDWLLKGAPPAKWLTDGVPAVKKGRDWGLDLNPGGTGPAGEGAAGTSMQVQQ